MEPSRIFPFNHQIRVGHFFVDQSGVAEIELFVVPSQTADTEEILFGIPGTSHIERVARCQINGHGLRSRQEHRKHESEEKDKIFHTKTSLI